MPGRATVADLIFETHAASVDNENGLASGHFDAPLSRRGEEQARDMGRRYAGVDFNTVYCSDLQRSWRTADLAFPGRAIIRTPLLRECDYGTLTRGPAANVDAARLRHIVDPWLGGESYADVVERVRSFLQSIRPEGRVLIIGHRAVWYALEHLLKGLPLADAVAAPWTWQPGWHYQF